MEYKFLKQWAREQTHLGLFFRTALRWRDQYALIFSKGSFLQVSLQSQAPFCFFSENEIINWQPAVELAIMEKHLKRALLRDIGIIDGERIIYLDFTKPDPFAQNQKFRLFLELIPQFTNIILTRREDNNWKIVDCSRKVTFSENPYRQIIPGVVYEYPPAGFKNSAEEIVKPLSFDKNLQIVENSAAGENDLNLFLESYYYEGWLQKLSEQTRNSSIKRLKNEIRKKERKLKKLGEELKVAEAGEKWKQQGELLKANLSLVKSGMESITLIDYFDPEMQKIEIKLVPDKNPAWNVANYFRKYRKAITGEKIIAEQIEKTAAEIVRIEKDIREITEINIVLPGELKQPQTAKTHIIDTLSRISFDENWEIIIGRNSKENDFITTRMGKPEDWWFHTRVFKGTHILLRNFNKNPLPPKLMEVCCRLAAYYSKASKSTNVPVDYTQIRYVRKPRGSAPGYVIYKNQKTLYVNPLDLRSARKEVLNLKF